MSEAAVRESIAPPAHLLAEGDDWSELPGSDFAGASVNDRRYFEVRERWEGTVEEAYETYFEATLINLASGEVLTAELLMDDVAPDDVALVEPGNLFYWHLGHRTRNSSDREKVSRIHFRRGMGVRGAALSRSVKANWLTSDD